VARRGLLAAERGQSVLVVGPTQSRKTSGFAVPAVLEWRGPVVAASVKSDLVRHTLVWRQSLGPAWVYDPTASTGLPGATWSPLDASGTWVGARRTAASLTEVARATAGSLTDADFWYATAAKLLAPLLLAAASSGRTMTDVVRWIDAQEVDEVADALVEAGEHQALQAALASWARDDRQRSAVYTTAEMVVDAFADPVVAQSAVLRAGADLPVAGVGAARAVAGAGSGIDPRSLVASMATLYLCAPAHDQRRLRPVFATVVGQVLEAAYERATRQGAPLDPPLLVVLDEAANVAPVAELDVLASTAAGHGVQLVTVWQDLAQLRARYGSRASSVVNNHRVKVFLSGISDPDTLEHASALIGEAELRQQTTTVDARGTTSRTDAPVPRRLVPPDALRRVAPGKAVVLSGHLPPVEVTLRPWQDDGVLRGRALADATTEPNGDDEVAPRVVTVTPVSVPWTHEQPGARRDRRCAGE
jgi:type IV secretion system protein VirD4